MLYIHVIMLLVYSFDNVKAIVFVVALSEFDEVLFEDSTINRWTPCCRHAVCASSYQKYQKYIY